MAPVLAIRPIPGAEARLDGVQGLLFTSSNGVRAFAALAAGRDLPAWCVGEATAAAARAAGFARVHAAGGDLAALARDVVARVRPEAGALFHAAGADLAGDLAGRLRAHGFTVDVRALYRAERIAALPDAVTAALSGESAPIDAVLFHSARGAETFAALVKRHEALARIDALCLSDAVAAAACRLPWRRVAVAAEPLDSALLQLLPAV